MESRDLTSRQKTSQVCGVGRPKLLRQDPIPKIMPPLRFIQPNHFFACPSFASPSSRPTQPYFRSRAFFFTPSISSKKTLPSRRKLAQNSNLALISLWLHHAHEYLSHSHLLQPNMLLML